MVVILPKLRYATGMSKFDLDILPAKKPKGWPADPELEPAVKAALLDFARTAEPASPGEKTISRESISILYPMGEHWIVYRNRVTRYLDKIGGPGWYHTRTQYDGTLRVWKKAKPADFEKLAKA